MSEPRDLALLPEYKATMERLASLKRVSPTGADYWLAREIYPILGYASWDGFDGVLERAMQACGGIGVPVDRHFRRTTKLVKLGSGAKRRIPDCFLSRSGCYLVAMNGDPMKPEVAAAQAYFAVQTRRMELQDEHEADERRLEMRQRVSASFKKVSGVAKGAGVKKQGVFHDARYQGLYGMPLRQVVNRKKVPARQRLFDLAGALELSANDFQMNLAADVIEREGIIGEQKAVDINRTVGRRVRDVMKSSGAPMPEDLPLEPPIKEVAKRLRARKAKLIK